jgi:hypothetical protein
MHNRNEPFCRPQVAKSWPRTLFPAGRWAAVLEWYKKAVPLDLGMGWQALSSEAHKDMVTPSGAEGGGANRRFLSLPSTWFLRGVVRGNTGWTNLRYLLLCDGDMAIAIFS